MAENPLRAVFFGFNFSLYAPALGAHLGVALLPAAFCLGNQEGHRPQGRRKGRHDAQISENGP